MSRAALMSRLILIVGAIVAMVIVGLNHDHLDAGFVERVLRGLGGWAPLVHVLLFALGTVLFVPGSIFGLTGGVLFGPVWGSILNLAGATLGAVAAFLGARYLGAEALRKRLGGRLDSLVAGVEAEGWRFVAFVRLVPLFPFNLLNYALGVTRIRLLPYTLATLVCMAPGTVAFTWLGYAGRQAITGGESAIRYGLIGVALVAIIAFLPRLLRRLKPQADSQWIDTDELAKLLDKPDVTVIDVRGADEFCGPLGHVAGAQNLPLAELARRAPSLAAFQRRRVVLVCRTDKRSSTAAATLRDSEFRNVRVLRGGMERWNRRGLPVSRSPAPTASS